MHWFCSIKLFLKLPFSKKKVIQLSKNHLNYRCFFSDTNLARGFFVECFGILNTFEDEISYFSSQSQTETISDFVLGVSFGGKFVTKSNFTAEVFLGIGRNLFNNNKDNYNNYSIVSRGGISLGYRF